MTLLKISSSHFLFIFCLFAAFAVFVSSGFFLMSEKDSNGAKGTVLDDGSGMNSALEL